MSRIRVGDRWIDLYGINDQTAPAHTQEMISYLKPSRGVVQCNQKTGDKYQCYADGKDLALLALRSRLARPAPDAPAEYLAAGGLVADVPGSALTTMQARGREVQQLPQGKIYLNAPKEMKVGDRRSVDARVGLHVLDDTLNSHSRVDDQSLPGSLKVSPEMVATLKGAGFLITPTSPEQQTVAEGIATAWSWEIEAKQDGLQELEATLYVLLPGSPPTSARQRIDSFTQKINVSVKPQTWSEWLKSAGEEIGALKAILLSLGAIAAAILSWLGISRKRQRRAPRTSPRAHNARTTAKAGSNGVGEKSA
jgi:hypothetical protein